MRMSSRISDYQLNVMERNQNAQYPTNNIEYMLRHQADFGPNLGLNIFLIIKNTHQQFNIIENDPNVQYQTNHTSQCRDIRQKLNIGPNCGPKCSKFGPDFFQPQNYQSNELNSIKMPKTASSQYGFVTKWLPHIFRIRIKYFISQGMCNQSPL